MVVISVYHHQPSLPTPILELTYQCHTSGYAFDKCRIFKVRRPLGQGFGVVNTCGFQLQQSRPPGQDFTSSPSPLPGRPPWRRPDLIFRTLGPHRAHSLF